mmetsp:Transcript_57223/g.123079  ORF Transcript_57223/g.123079 Transcript_57223/m.123079 type:complete len:201 (-) Transcript_57223:1006-1608(-)
MHFSSFRKYIGSDNFVTVIFFSLPMLRTQRLACPCGSIIKGQRRPLVTMSPFSTERSSDGKLLIFQDRTSAGSTRTSAAFHSGSVVKLSSAACAHQSLTSLRRNSAVKGPVYAMKPLQRMMSPTTNSRFFVKMLLAAFQRTLSLPKPAKSFSARSSLTTHSSASASNWAAFFFAPSKRASSAATLSRTNFSSACLIAHFS